MWYARCGCWLARIVDVELGVLYTFPCLAEEPRGVVTSIRGILVFCGERNPGDWDVKVDCACVGADIVIVIVIPELEELVLVLLLLLLLL